MVIFTVHLKHGRPAVVKPLRGGVSDYEGDRVGPFTGCAYFLSFFLKGGLQAVPVHYKPAG